ncbi:hypothetical protein INT45_000438 [Circinella minor]|uniref:Uncharacterized protein n=1 Tax=Circinella minor TaxID=1195481 RepID=A0A8H7RWJ6_9FUNG|nr:hypothetical protein INT45_000438 [Circinella minor]
MFALVHPKLSNDDIIAAVLNEHELDEAIVVEENNEFVDVHGTEPEPKPIISSKEKIERIEKVIGILDEVEHLTVKDELRKIRDELRRKNQVNQSLVTSYFK